MDLLEMFYAVLSNRLRSKKKIKALEFEASFEENYFTALLFAQGVAGEASLILRSVDRGLGSIYEDCILLPSSIHFTKNTLLNRDILLHKALVAGAIFRLRLKSLLPGEASPLERAFEIYSKQKKIELLISEKFPNYNEWRRSLEDRLKVELHNSSSEKSKSERIWTHIIQSLSNSIEPAHLYGALIAKHKREMEELPVMGLALWCELMKNKAILSGSLSRAGEDLKRESKRDQVRPEKKYSEVKSVDLDKEKKKENPVTHSFEKLETADEYKGGYRHADGEDQLEEHGNALDELELKHVTRSGEQAKSVYSADISGLVETQSLPSTAAPENQIKLPEWDYRKDELLPEFCSLFTQQCNISSAEINETFPKWYLDLIDLHKDLLDPWKQRLESLLNRRALRDRQWDGSDISIDAYVRYLADTKTQAQGDARIFVKSLRSVREFSSLLLIDQSLSTDSWVMNRRVLDIELESIALMSHLLGDFHESVAVAGTYSHTRHHCSFNLYKDFNDSWDIFLNQTKKIEPIGYTRLGPSIRYATDVLVKQGGHQKLLILLTDGKPTDYDRYEGRYGIEDIRHATLEAKQKGIHVRALAIEKEAKDYFPHLFGKNEYQIIQNVAELPSALFRIYFESIRSN